ncbi:MAG TPA: SRPBCC family protein [Candidatus Elarobacter sp.]
MAEHAASVTVNAPVHQVYELYTHFNDYPKFMTFVKEVTYLDDERSHWVVDIAGRHEWDAVNENWIPDRQIGWRSVDGLANAGVARFESLGPHTTRLTVSVSYDPPAGVLGTIGEALGAGTTFEKRLQHDLDHFAAMVDHAPPGALDPTSSSYLFHADSAAARGDTTVAQNESMGMTPEPAPPAMSGATLPTETPSTSDVTADDLATSDETVPRVPGTSPGRELT